ncbi:hypothetical protein ACVWY0_003101 [Arthrobacter sp. UYNi723]
MRIRAGWLVATTRTEKKERQKGCIHMRKPQVTAVHRA